MLFKSVYRSYTPTRNYFFYFFLERHSLRISSLRFPRCGIPDEFVDASIGKYTLAPSPCVAIFLFTRTSTFSFTIYTLLVCHCVMYLLYCRQNTSWHELEFIVQNSTLNKDYCNFLSPRGWRVRLRSRKYLNVLVSEGPAIKRAFRDYVDEPSSCPHEISQLK